MTWSETATAYIASAGNGRGNSPNLSVTRVTGVGFKELTGLKKLYRLDLSASKVTDAGLRELAGLQSLQELDLSQIQVTNDGVREFQAIKGLRKVTFDGFMPVTATGLEELQAAMPDCWLIY